MNGFDFYHSEIPDFIKELCSSPVMQRLRDVGMNCGCEYTQFPRFTVCDPYTRYEHSIGVGLIVWHFTGDVKQSIAALLHDAATPVFAHVIDFLHGDHLTQEYTESGTRSLLESSAEIQTVLQRYALCTDDVCDYHIYPIADNDTPMLSADRLEYTLGNAVNYRFTDISTVNELYNDICVGTNEHDAPELMFQSLENACRFGELAMRCSEVYVADEDRYSMQELAELLRDAVSDGIINTQSLNTTETEVLLRLCADEHYRKRWENFRSLRRMERSDDCRDGFIIVPAKKRYIDPYVQNQARLSVLNSEYGAKINEFVSRRLDYYVRGFI